MVVWQGVTASGSVVPVQVNEDGSVVAQGVDGIAGLPGKEGPPGPQGPEGPSGADGADGANGQYAEGDDVVFANGTFTEDLTIGFNGPDDFGFVEIPQFGTVKIHRNLPEERACIQVVNTAINGGSQRAQITNFGNYVADGTISCAKNKAGFTSTGELYFSSRGNIYKLVVASNGLVSAEPYVPVSQKELPDGPVSARSR